MIPMDNVKKRLVIFSSLIIAATIFSGCNGTFGGLRRSPEITKVFQQQQMLPGYNYYYDGRAAIPYAVVGRRDDYVLTSKFWTRLKGHRSIRKAAQLSLRIRRSPSPWAEIIDPEGNPMGIWFSVFISTRVQFGPENQVDVFSPYSPSRHAKFKEGSCWTVKIVL